MAMMKVHESRPEPILFLLEAADAMEAYRARHGAYASAWHQLDIDFAARPFRLGDPGTHPTPEDERSWRPKDCAYTYWIEPAPPGRFLNRARDDAGAAAYEMEPGLDAPRKLPGPTSP